MNNNKIATLPPACSPYDFGRRAKPWPACAKASAKASGQVDRNDKKGIVRNDRKGRLAMTEKGGLVIKNCEGPDKSGDYKIWRGSE